MIGDSAFAAATDQTRVLAKNAAAVARFRLDPSLFAALQFSGINIELQQLLLSINGDGITDGEDMGILLENWTG